MMFKFDTVTGDLIDTAEFFDEDPTNAAAVFCQLNQDFGWLGDPLTGFRKEVIADSGDGPADEQEVKVEVDRCIGVLASAKLVADSTTVVAREQAGRFRVDSSYRDLATNSPVHSKIPVGGG